jgi:hypothetical protein
MMTKTVFLIFYSLLSISAFWAMMMDLTSVNEYGNQRDVKVSDLLLMILFSVLPVFNIAMNLLWLRMAFRKIFPTKIKFFEKVVFTRKERK